MSKGDREFEQIVQTRAKDPPAMLYKYTTFEAAHDILSTGKLRFRSPLSFNDPFDSQWDVMWPIYTPRAREHARKAIREALLDPEAWPDEADPQFESAMRDVRERVRAVPTNRRDAEITSFIEGAEEALSVGNAADRLQRTLRKLRVQCFSETDRSILMWSHYADQHAGVALGFNTTALERGLRRPLEPISYSMNLPELIDYKAWNRSMIFGTPSPGFQDDPRYWALTKHTDWSYEREWRFVWLERNELSQDSNDYAYPRETLAEILLGCKTNDALSKDLLSLAMEKVPQARRYVISRNPMGLELLKEEILS